MTEKRTIGKLIEKEVRKQQLSIVEFADRICCCLLYTSIACVENDENRQLHDFIIQNEGKVHALYYIWKYGKNRIYGCAYIKTRDEHR